MGTSHDDWVYAITSRRPFHGYNRESSHRSRRSRDATKLTIAGQKSTRGLAALQGLIFYESGFSVLDLSKMNWLPKQYPKLARGEEAERFEEEEEEEKMELLRLPNKVQTMSTYVNTELVMR